MKKVLKFIAAVFLIGMAIAVFAAIFRQETYPSAVKGIVKNEVLAEYYSENGTPPAAFTHDMIDSFDYEGNVQAKHLVYIPDARQIQISVRYGTVAFENIAEDYELDAVPTLENAHVTFKLKALSLKDEAFTNDDNNITEDEILDSLVVEKSTSVDIVSGRHRYSRFVFDGIDLERFNCLYIEMYYGDKDTPYTSLIIYHKDAAEYSEKSVKISASDCTMPQ